MGAPDAPAAPANPPEIRGNPPLPLTPLIGREGLLRWVRETIDLDAHPGGTRLVTLTGPGGVGKTRLALQAAIDLVRDWGIAPVFVDLAPITDPGLVPAAIALALGVREGGAHSLLDVIKDSLQASPTLLLLDNCEQVLAGTLVVSDLLRSCPLLTVLATSRAPLRLSGEIEIPAPPLDLPPPDRPLVSSTLIDFAAVRLFVERARAGGADLPLTDETAPAIAAICRRLDGLPLALELAATRTKALPPHALLARLDPALPYLTGGPRDHPARLRSMADAIAWSYGLLTPEERRVFRHLAVFVGGFTLDAAEAVANGGDTADAVRESVFEGLSALLDHSLIRRDAGGGAEPRFNMLETIREFGLGRLVADGEAERARVAHASHFLDVAEATAPHLKGSDQGRWLDRLEADHGNLRAALTTFAERGEAQAALRLSGALVQFWWMRGHLSEGRAWYERLLAAARDLSVDPVVRARALNGAAVLAHAQRDLDQTAALLEEALVWARVAGGAREIADALNFLGRVALDRGDLDRAAGWFEAAIPHYQAANHPQGLAGCRNNLAVVWRERGELDRAAPLFEEALAGFRTVGEWRGVGVAANNLGLLATLRGDLATAAGYHREGLAAFRQVGDRIGLVGALEDIAHLAHAAGQPAEAIRLLAAAAALHAAIGSAAGSDVRPYVERTLAAARSELDPAIAAVAWEGGGALSLDEALADAWRAIELSAPTEPEAASPLAGLTAREIDVLRLIAAGRTDREIGEALFISPSTATRHGANLYRKLGVHSRADVTYLARRHGLV